MRWSANLADRSSHTAPAHARSDWSAITARWVQLWHGRSEPAARVHRTEVSGCTLLVLGCCTSSSQSLTTIAVRVAAGDFAALGAVGGSRVVIAVRPDDVVVVGDISGQCVVFYATLPDGTVSVGSH